MHAYSIKSQWWEKLRTYVQLAHTMQGFILLILTAQEFLEPTLCQRYVVVWRVR